MSHVAPMKIPFGAGKFRFCFSATYMRGVMRCFSDDEICENFRIAISTTLADKPKAFQRDLTNCVNQLEVFCG